MFNFISSLGTSFMAHLFCIFVEYKMYKMFNKALPKTCWTITNYFVNLMIISHRVKNIITNFIKMLFYFTIISIMTMYSFLGHPFFPTPTLPEPALGIHLFKCNQENCRGVGSRRRAKPQISVVSVGTGFEATESISTNKNAVFSTTGQSETSNAALRVTLMYLRLLNLNLVTE